MSNRQPDIEIYAKRASLAAICNWLSQYFEIHDQSASGDTIQLRLGFDGSELECMIVEKAVKGGYASIWFKNNHTPWPTDETCAEDAHATLGVEVRCSKSGWQPGDDDHGGWYRFTDGEKSTVNWLA